MAETITIKSSDVCIVTDHPASQVILYKPRENEDFHVRAITLPSSPYKIEAKGKVEGICLSARDIVELTLKSRDGEVVQATGAQISNGNGFGREKDPEVVLKHRGELELVLTDVDPKDSLFKFILQTVRADISQLGFEIDESGITK